MAFAAVISLKDTIRRLLNSPRISVAFSTREFLEYAYEHADSLQEALRRYDDIRNSSEGVMASNAKIREAVRSLEDAIEFHASAQFLSQSQIHGALSLNLDQLNHHIHRFAETARKMGDEYMMELNKPSGDEEEEDAAAAAIVLTVIDDADGSEFEMVGLSDQFLEIRKLLTEDLVNYHQFIFTVGIVGMPGIGKTTLVRKIFHDSLVKENFECRAFLTLGRKCRFEHILRGIIAQVNLDNDEMIVGGDEDLVNYLQRSLMGRKYLIVLDNILDIYLFLQVQAILPVEHNGSAILAVSIGSEENIESIYFFKMRFLDEKESWDLLKKKVFDEEEECPPHLVKAGKKIAENCEGLPLLIVTVAELLSEASKDLEYWNEVAEERNSVFEDALDQVYEVLLPSYQCIPQYLQMNFLYMGVFPKYLIITNSNFGNLWRAEGFYDLPFFDALHLLTLCNLVVVRRSSTMSMRTKACSLHCAYRHLTKREADKNKVFHILKSYADCSIELVGSHRCLVIHQNVLFAVKEVHDTLASVAAVRSVLCMGPYHQYQVPICSDWELLRVLNALAIRFYEFPLNLVNLILLRYLALTCNGNLPRSVSNLWNLQYLIIHQHLRIKSMKDDNSHLPMEIWDLKELMHLQIMGRNLPDPPPGAVLPKLAELLDVGVQSCTKKVLQSVPNLEKLRIQIELAPVVAAHNLSCFDHISCLHQLRSFQSVIMNPHLLIEPIVPPPPLSISTSILQKLTLNGFGFPWVEMSKIAKLPNLEKLVLQCFAFRGEKWDANEMEFSKLWYLCIEDTDLVQWSAGNESFKMLGHVTMKYCHKLQEIPFLMNCVEIELVDCKPLAETCAKKWCRSVITNYSWK